MRIRRVITKKAAPEDGLLFVETYHGVGY